MPGAKGVSETVWDTLATSLTCTTSCVDVLDCSAAGTSTLIWLSLLNRICPGSPSNVTDKLAPENLLPMRVAIDPGASAPGAKVAAFTMPATVGVGTGGGSAAVITKLIGTSRVPARGPSSIVRIAL